ncbi:MAG: hypothetical protein Q8N81_05565, partial [bacterium]|nr:hypothetical protein [bacterium]
MKKKWKLPVQLGLLVALVMVGWFMPQWTSAQEGAVMTTAPAAAAAHGEEPFQLFSFMTSEKFSQGERIALFVVLGIAVAGLLYAVMLVGQ